MKNQKNQPAFQELNLKDVSHSLFTIFTFLIIFSLFFTCPQIIKSEEIQTAIVYSELADGVSKFLGSPNNHTWNEVRNAQVGNQKYENMTVYYKGILSAYNTKQGEIYVVSRSYFQFDTSFLKESDDINNVTLNLYGKGANQSRVCVVEWLDGEDGVNYDDYGYTGSLLFGVSSPWKTETYNQINFNPQGIQAINKSGYTYVACREYDHDFLNISPFDNTFAEYRNGHYFADENGTDKDPYLLITFSNTEENSGNDNFNTPFIKVPLFLIILILLIVFMKTNKKIK